MLSWTDRYKTNSKRMIADELHYKRARTTLSEGRAALLFGYKGNSTLIHLNPFLCPFCCVSTYINHVVPSAQGTHILEAGYQWTITLRCDCGVRCVTLKERAASKYEPHSGRFGADVYYCNEAAQTAFIDLFIQEQPFRTVRGFGDDVR